MCYVSGTKDRGLFYQHGVAKLLVGYTDANWAGDASDHRSISGFTFSLGNAVVVWSSKKHSTLALSSTKAKYKAAIDATCEVRWLQQLLQDL